MAPGERRDILKSCRGFRRERFLFTDIEGSTRVLRELGDAYVEALAAHRAVIREAVARYGGVEVDTQGDAFFVAFSRASDAVAAATDAQAALGEGPLRVRMGLHTGEPLVTEDGYVGMDVHRAARIAAAGHGGQILMSQATRDLVGGAGVRDLGEHRLKDLSAPERMWQLGDEDFPPLKTLYRTNLPVQPTPLVGRERELDEAAAILREARLLTLVGPGGTGKTRLGLQLAVDSVEESRDGVFFVPLEPIVDAELVVPAIAQSVGATVGLDDHLRDQELLLVLDNFEHLSEAAGHLASLLGEAPRVKALVTSRAPLHVSAEREYAVPPLAGDEAVELFLERAHDGEPKAAVEEICRRLDRLPLALELAAARTKVLPPPMLLERLERRLPLLTGGARDVPERQRTLFATIEWSHGMLSSDEQRLFARLAVFAGGWTLEAAEEVAGANPDALEALVDQSLVYRRGGRYFMLETIREYALERFEESGEADDVRRRHAEHYIAVVERAVPTLDLGGDPVAIAAEYENLRAALRWLEASGDALAELWLAASLRDFWRLTRRMSARAVPGSRVLLRRPAASGRRSA